MTFTAGLPTMTFTAALATMTFTADVPNIIGTLVLAHSPQLWSPLYTGDEPQGADESHGSVEHASTSLFSWFRLAFLSLATFLFILKSCYLVNV